MDPHGEEWISHQWGSGPSAGRIEIAFYYPSDFGAPPLQVGEYRATWTVEIESEGETAQLHRSYTFAVDPSVRSE